jgi:hypothetical protein
LKVRNERGSIVLKNDDPVDVADSERTVGTSAEPDVRDSGHVARALVTPPQTRKKLTKRVACTVSIAGIYDPVGKRRERGAEQRVCGVVAEEVDHGRIRVSDVIGAANTRRVRRRLEKCTEVLLGLPQRFEGSDRRRNIPQEEHRTRKATERDGLLLTIDDDEGPVASCESDIPFRGALGEEDRWIYATRNEMTILELGHRHSNERVRTGVAEKLRERRVGVTNMPVFLHQHGARLPIDDRAKSRIVRDPVQHGVAV